MLFELSGHGITFFVTTHYMDEAERCSHVAYIYYGKIIADGTPNSLRELPEVQPAGTDARRNHHSGSYPRAGAFARTIPGIRSATIFGQSIHALIDDDLDLEDLRDQLLKERHRRRGNSSARAELSKTSSSSSPTSTKR